LHDYNPEEFKGMDWSCVIVPKLVAIGQSVNEIWPFIIFGRPIRPMLSVRFLSVCPVCNVGVLYPNGWMDQDETWHADRPRSWPHCVRWGPSFNRGHRLKFCPNFMPICPVTKKCKFIVPVTNKKLIRRWDNERELFYDDIVHKFGEITRNKGHYAVQGHSRLPLLVPNESSYRLPIKTKFYYTSWFGAGSELVRKVVRSQIPLRYLIRTSFEPVPNQLA